MLCRPFLLELPQSHNLAGEPFPWDLPSVKFWVRLSHFCSFPFIFPAPKQGEWAKKRHEDLHKCWAHSSGGTRRNPVVLKALLNPPSWGSPLAVTSIVAF